LELAVGYRIAVSIGDLVAAPIMGSADLQQAEYFYTLLIQQRSELCEGLDRHRAALARFERIGDPSGVRRKQRTIMALESELRTIDRLNKALRVRIACRMQPLP
jgi:hypothetical protein